MASVLKIKRSTGSTPPNVLASGELAYAWDEAGGFQNGKLFIGTGSESNGEAANVEVIGGKYFTNLLDHQPGTVVASSAVIVDSLKRVNEWTVGSINLNQNVISTTGDLTISPAGGVVTVNGEVIAAGFVGNLIGNATTASALDTTRSIGLIGAVTGAATNFDGTSNILIPITSVDISHPDVTGVLSVTHGGTGTTTSTGAGSVVLSNSPELSGIPTAPTASLGTNSGQIATTAFVASAVDAARSGLDAKESVRAATTQNISLMNTQEVDGIFLSVGDRVLVKNQTQAEENGIYIVEIGSWIRSSDADQELTPGAFVFVEQGVVNADTGWVLSNDGIVAVGSTPQTWVQFSGAGQIIAGDGLVKAGNTISAVAGDGLAVSTDSIGLTGQALALHNLSSNGLFARTAPGSVAARTITGTTDRLTVTNGDGVNGNPILDISSTYLGQTSITTLGTITTGIWNGSVVGVSYGGTGLSNVASRAIVYGNGTSALGVTGTSLIDGSFLREDATGNPYWSNVVDGGTY